MKCFKDLAVSTRLVNLTRRLVAASADEIGQAAGAFNSMMKKLQPPIASVRDSAMQVAAQADALASESARIKAGSVRQSEQTTGVAVAFEDLAEAGRSALHNASEGARRMAELAQTLQSQMRKFKS